MVTNSTVTKGEAVAAINREREAWIPCSRRSARTVCWRPAPWGTGPSRTWSIT